MRPELKLGDGVKYTVRWGKVRCRWMTGTGNPPGPRVPFSFCHKSCGLLGKPPCPRALPVGAQMFLEEVTGRPYEELVEEGRHLEEARRWKIL